MTALPDYTTPDELAEHLGWSERRVREVARRLGACRVLGNRMVLFPIDVVCILKAARPGVTVEDVKAWLDADAAEMMAEKEAQDWAEPTGVVYFVRRADEVKIGYSINVQRRLSNFRSATSEEFILLLTVPAIPVLEDYFHQKFAVDRIVRELFRYSEDIQGFIARRNRSVP